LEFKRSSFLAALLLIVPTLAFAQQSSAGVSTEPVVVTTGRGVVQAAPDRAWITIGAESRAASPSEAQRRNTEAMRPVLDRLRAAGLPAEAIRTVGYDVQYEWDFVNNKRVGRGYVARNTIEARVDDVDRVGEYLEIAAGSGATALGGVRFDLKDRSKLEREALRLAVADARGKADAVAAGAGRSIDRILQVAETGTRGPEPRPMPMMRQTLEAASADAPQISPGQTEITASVTLTAALK
jgi:uncharacterized protein YggE